MPFAEVPGGVSAGFELSRESGRFWIEPLGHAAFFIVATIVEIGRDAIAMRVLPGGERDAGW